MNKGALIDQLRIIDSYICKNDIKTASQITQKLVDNAEAYTKSEQGAIFITMVKCLTFMGLPTLPFTLRAEALLEPGTVQHLQIITYIVAEIANPWQILLKYRPVYDRHYLFQQMFAQHIDCIEERYMSLKRALKICTTGTVYDECLLISSMAMMLFEFHVYDECITYLERLLRLDKRCNIDFRGVSPTILLKETIFRYQKDRPLWGDENRFRLCNWCDKLIDRNPLVEAGTDFLECSQCHRVAYCSVECNDAGWHGGHCNTCEEPKRTRFVDVDDPKHCSHCLLGNARKKCPCKKVRYCNRICQEADWEKHRENHGK